MARFLAAMDIFNILHEEVICWGEQDRLWRISGRRVIQVEEQFEAAVEGSNSGWKASHTTLLVETQRSPRTVSSSCLPVQITGNFLKPPWISGSVPMKIFNKNFLQE